MKTELYALVHGHVQGVFFRRTVYHHAQALSLTGTVSNLADGTVEIVAQGEREVLERFVELVREEPGSAQIAKIETRYSPPKRSHSGFEIAYKDFQNHR